MIAHKDDYIIFVKHNMVKKKRMPKLDEKKTKFLPNVNPFELKFNRLKHDVLGKKKGSLGVGHPGLSRKRAFEQRKKSLGVEYDRRGKVNKIVDRRLGERSKGISSEEKASLRFSAERLNYVKKGSKFNLTDEREGREEILTHGGEALTTIQKYDKTIASDDEDDTGNIGADVVKIAHFGGGEFNSLSSSGGKLSRKEVIADLIAKTRQSRENKHYTKDELQSVTEELDAKYLNILDKVKGSFRLVGAAKFLVVDKDDYDRLALSLKLDADSRATPAERTKTTEEVAMEERLRLEELESLRIARMNLEYSESSHLSVDAEGGSEIVENKEKRSRFEVLFDRHGKMLNINKIGQVSKQKGTLDSDEELLDEELEDENGEDLDDLLQENRCSNESSTALNASGSPGRKRKARNGVNELRDYGADDVSSNNGEVSRNDEKGKGEESRSEIKPQLGAQELELPFVIEMPKNFEGLADLLTSYPIQKIGVLLQRLIKCYHPSLAEGNKKLLSKLFLYLLRFFDNISNRPLTSEILSILGSLTASMYMLMKFDIEFSVRCIRALIRQHWKKRLINSKAPTPFSMIALLRLVASLYPVSDNWHPVCSPAMALAAMTLARCHVVNLTILARQILLLTVISDFVEESKRFVPEAVAFCQGALLMAVENEEHERAPTIVFPVSLPHKQMLYVKENIARDANVEPLRFSEVFADETTSLNQCDMKRCQILRALIAAIQKYRIIYSAYWHTFTITFTPLLDLLKRVPLTRLPSMLAEEIEVLIQSMEAECKVRAQVTQMTQVVIEKSMLKMLEPRFEVHFDPERPRVNRDQRRNGARAEKEKLHYLIRKETRGAVKELRKDASFLSRKQRRDALAKDRERQEKTKRIIGGLQSQQGEWNRELWESGKKKKKK